MQEAIREIIKFAECEMLIKQINANVFIGNIKSIKLLEKNSFTVTGSKIYIFKSKDYPHKMYSLYIKCGVKK